MVLTAVRGALGFCSRLPVGHDEAAFEAFCETPVAFVLTGYVLGALLAVPVALAAAHLPGATTALVLPVAVVALTGVHHLDGVADLGDAAVVHGPPDERRAVMMDTTVGVGAAAAVALVVAGLALAGLGLAGAVRDPLAVAGIVVASEVGAKLGMAALACLGTATHDGLGSAMTTRADPGTLVGPLVLAVPALGATFPSPAAFAAVAAAGLTALAVLYWAREHLGGVSGDVFGATNELARVATLHAAVATWVIL